MNDLSISSSNSNRSLSKSSNFQKLKDDAFYNYIFERTIRITTERWNILTPNGINNLKTQLIDPSQIVSIIWSIILTLFDFTYTPFVLPVLLTFSSFERWNSWSIIELTTECFLCIAFIFNICIGYIAWINNEFIIIRDFRLSFYLHWRYGSFIIDFISVLPLISFVLLAIGIVPSIVQRIVFILMFCRLIRMIRIINLISKGSLSHTLFTLLNIPLNVYTSKILLGINMTYIGSIVVNSLSCLWYGVARLQGYTGTWIEEAGIQPDAKFDSYIASAYFTMTTLTTVGYGDITPTNSVERIVSIFIMIIGVSFFLILVGMVNEVFATFGHIHKTNAIIRKIENVKHISDFYTLKDKDVKTNIKKYYQNYWQHENNQTCQELFDDLPGTLRIALIASITNIFFTTVPRFAILSDEHKVIILANLKNIPLSWKDQELCYIGQPFICYWLLIEGSFKINESTIEAPYFLGDEIQHNGFIIHNVICRKKCIVFKLDKNIMNKIELVQTI
jgi:voltage-gated potassium channel